MATNFITPKFKYDPNGSNYFIKAEKLLPEPAGEDVELIPVQWGRFLNKAVSSNGIYTTTETFSDRTVQSSTTTIGSGSDIYTNVTYCSIYGNDGLIGDTKVVIK